MPFNLLLFPLVGGYYIIANSELFKYKTQRLHNERLIFNSVIAGCILLSVCFILKWLSYLCVNDLIRQIWNLLPIKQDYFGVTIFSFLIGIAATEFINLFIKEVSQIKKAIDKIGNDLEKLLLYSADNRELIQVTLKNDKVYVGICGRIPVPDKTTYIDLIPFFSGYRDPTTKNITFTTDYLDVYSEFVKEGKIMAIQDLGVNTIIRTDEILSAGRFDPEVYEKFSSKEDQTTN